MASSTHLDNLKQRLVSLQGIDSPNAPPPEPSERPGSMPRVLMLGHNGGNGASEGARSLNVSDDGDRMKHDNSDEFKYSEDIKQQRITAIDAKHRDINAREVMYLGTTAEKAKQDSTVSTVSESERRSRQQTGSGSSDWALLSAKAGDILDQEIHLLQRKLNVSEALYEEMNHENQRLTRENNHLQEERSALTKLLDQQRAKTLESKDQEKENVSDMRRELEIMQAQLKLTCQEIITLRKTVASKDEQYQKLKKSSAKEASSLLQRAQEALESTKEMQQQSSQLEKECHELRAANATTQRMVAENARLTSELKLRKDQLEGANRAKNQAETEVCELRKVADQLADDLLQQKESAGAQSQRRALEEIAEEKRKHGEEKEQWEQVRQSLEEEVLILKRAVVESETKLLEVEKERTQIESEYAAARLAFQDEKNAAKSSLQTAKDHIRELSKAKDESLQLLKDSKRKADYAYQLKEEAEAKTRKAEEQATRALAELSEKVQTQLEAILKSAAKAQAARDRQIQSLNDRIEARDTEIQRVRGMWRDILFAHPDLDQVEQNEIEEMKTLVYERMQLEKQCEELREDNEGLVVMVAMQHLRLLIARWRNPIFRERFRMQHAAAVRAELLAEEAEVRGIADGSVPVPPLSDLPPPPPDPNEEVSNMIRSIQQEVMRQKTPRSTVSPSSKATNDYDYLKGSPLMDAFEIAMVQGGTAKNTVEQSTPKQILRKIGGDPEEADGSDEGGSNSRPESPDPECKEQTLQDDPPAQSKRSEGLSESKAHENTELPNKTPSGARPRRKMKVKTQQMAAQAILKAELIRLDPSNQKDIMVVGDENSPSGYA